MILEINSDVQLMISNGVNPSKSVFLIINHADNILKGNINHEPTKYFIDSMGCPGFTVFNALDAILIFL
jgi:hypothetical protein